MAGWPKAGMIGAVIVVVLKALQQVPCVVCFALPLEWAAYGGIGALAAYWIRPVRTMESGARQGALAALMAAAIGIGVNMMGATALGPVQESMLRQMPPEFFGQLAEAGIDPELISTTGGTTAETVSGSLTCCGAGLVIAAALGAVGGLVQVRPEKGRLPQPERLEPQIAQLPAPMPEPIRRGELPPKCVQCGAPIRESHVTWVGPSSAECPYCGSVIKAE